MITFVFSEYFQVVIDDLSTNSEQCVSNLKTAMAQVDDLLLNPSEDESLTSIFNLCEPLEQYDIDHYSVANFYNLLVDVFAVVAQYNGLLEVTIDDLCNILTDENEGKEIIRLANIVKLIYGTSCASYNYEDDLTYLKNTSINGDGK